MIHLYGYSRGSKYARDPVPILTAENEKTAPKGAALYC
jgi:hypothetical protein